MLPTFRPFLLLALLPPACLSAPPSTTSTSPNIFTEITNYFLIFLSLLLLVYLTRLYLNDATPANAVQFTVFSAESHNTIDNNGVLSSDIVRAGEMLEGEGESYGGLGISTVNSEVGLGMETGGETETEERRVQERKTEERGEKPEENVFNGDEE